MGRQRVNDGVEDEIFPFRGRSRKRFTRDQYSGLTKTRAGYARAGGIGKGVDYYIPYNPPAGGGIIPYRPPGWNGSDPRYASSFPGFHETSVINSDGDVILDDAYSWYINIGDVNWSGGGDRRAVRIAGGRHRVIIGGSIIGTSTTTAGNASDHCALILDDGVPGYETWVEGMYIRSVNGPTIRSQQTFTFAYNHINAHAYQNVHDSAHPDVIQVWDRGRIAGIRCSYLTGVSGYTGLSILDLQTPHYWDLDHVDLMQDVSHGNMQWYGDAMNTDWNGSHLNCWVECADGTEMCNLTASYGVPFGDWRDNVPYEIYNSSNTLLYTSPLQVNAGDGVWGKNQGDWIAFSRAQINGGPITGMSWSRGHPPVPGGQYVPAANVGTNYVPVGYI